MIVLTLLVLGCVTLFLLPLVPAFIEWRQPSDAAPLKVVREHSGHISHFANSFRSFFQAKLKPILDRAIVSNVAVRETLADGTAILALPQGGNFLDLGLASAPQEAASLILAAGDLELPSEQVLTGEIYVEGSLLGRQGVVLRAALAQGDIHLESQSYVLRWLHADGVVTAGENSKLYGRVSAGQRLTLEAGCLFTRMHAPRIEVVAQPCEGQAPRIQRSEDVLLAESSMRQAFKGRRVQRGDISVSAQTHHLGDLIASQRLLVGCNAVVSGDIKGREVVLEAGSYVNGSVVASDCLVLQNGSRASGPIVAESTVDIGVNCIVGTPELPTTISAPRIRIAPGAVVHGLVWAREEGEVRA